MVVTEFGRSNEWNLGTSLHGDFSDFNIVGGHEDPVEAATRNGGLDRPHNHRLSAKQFYVLSRNSLATTPGRYHRYFHDETALEMRSTTRSNCASVIVGYIGKLSASA